MSFERLLDGLNFLFGFGLSRSLLLIPRALLALVRAASATAKVLVVDVMCRPSFRRVVIWIGMACSFGGSMVKSYRFCIWTTLGRPPSSLVTNSSTLMLFVIFLFLGIPRVASCKAALDW